MPSASTSTTPPRVSPALWAASTAATIRSLVPASKQRSGSASSAATSPGPGSGAPSGTRTSAMAVVWETSRMPSAASTCEATTPSATRVAVSRAEARSSTGRASSKPYFCMPVRSACPGRGRVSGALRARPSRTCGSTGSELITSCHLGHSVLAISMATGPPWVTPWRTPPRMRTRSCSNFMRAPRP